MFLQEMSWTRQLYLMWRPPKGLIDAYQLESSVSVIRHPVSDQKEIEYIHHREDQSSSAAQKRGHY